jgi:phenylalanyl-tRNA synthetase alpha chain
MEHNLLGRFNQLCAHLQAVAHSRLALTPEARDYIAAGHSPEAVVYNAVPSEGAEMHQVQSTVEKSVWAVGFKKAMEKGWIKMSKEGGKSLLSRKVNSVEDTCLSNLRAVDSQAAVEDSVAAELKKRKLVKLEQWKTFKISQGPAFALDIVKPETDLTADLLQSGEWQTKQFKDYNFNVRRRAVASLTSSSWSLWALPCHYIRMHHRGPIAKCRRWVFSPLVDICTRC